MKEEVIDAFRKGESWAFEEIYLRFLNPIKSYVETRVSNEFLAQEIIQEIFLKMYRFSEHYHSGFAFTTWLWTIARNTLSDFGRKNAAHRIHTLESQAISIEDIPASDASADQWIDRKKIRRALFQVSRILSPIQRRILWMRLVIEMPYQEIALKLGMSTSGVRSLVHRAKKILMNEGMLIEFAETLS